jgi:hypothetical protein
VVDVPSTVGRGRRGITQVRRAPTDHLSRRGEVS